MAEALGFLLFRQGRLERDLALAVVWSNDGTKLEDLSVELREASLFALCEKARILAETRYANDPDARSEWGHWLSGVDAIRSERNRLVHSRWGFDPITNLAEAVLSIPTAPATDCKKYSVIELKELTTQFDRLGAELNALRKRFPL